MIFRGKESGDFTTSPDRAIENFIFLGLDPNQFDKYFHRGGVFTDGNRSMVYESLSLAEAEARFFTHGGDFEFSGVSDSIIAMMFRSSLMRKDFRVVSGSGGRGTRYSFAFNGSDIFPWYQVQGIFTNIAGFNKIKRSFETVKPYDLPWKNVVDIMRIINGFSSDYGEMIGERAMELNRW